MTGFPIDPDGAQGFSNSTGEAAGGQRLPFSPAASFIKE
jgi:hypothetical protein